MFRILITLILITFTAPVFAGNNNPEASKTIKGTVTDDNGQPLTGVEVIVEGLNKKVYTDFDGNFEIDQLQGGAYTVVFSYVSYKEKKAVVKATDTQQPIEVKLERKKLL